MNHWYERHRWCQCNQSEIDPAECDLDLWRRFWREKGIQGTIVNAAGTVAFYPSANKYQYRAKYLDDRDFLGDLIKAAREEGLAIVARMDCNQTNQELIDIHPDWFCRDKDGNPIQMVEGRYLTCTSSDYEWVHIAEIIKEVYDRYKPEAFADNSWAGHGTAICYCDNCRKKFREYCGKELPEKADYDDPAYRLWINWNIDTRTKLYHHLNSITKSLGGEDCIYMGMLHSNVFTTPHFAGYMDLTGILDETVPAVMIDGQARERTYCGLDQNTIEGMALRETLGDKALIIESNAAYYIRPLLSRRIAAAKAESESWMRASLIAGIAPSVHIIGGTQEDTRVYENGNDVYRWEKENEEYLFDRRNTANIAILRNFANYYHYGQDKGKERCIQPLTGIMGALKSHRISYRALETRQLKSKADGLKVIILPDIAVISDEELQDIIDFIKGGGSIVYTGATGMLDKLGYPRKNFPLDDLFGITRRETFPVTEQVPQYDDVVKHLGDYINHTYIRIAAPEHPIFRGFEKTAILFFGGLSYDVRSTKLEALAHMIPAFPVYPPETSYMEPDKRVSDIPTILAGETGFGGRVVYFPTDYDRRNGCVPFGDHEDLLANAVRWALDGEDTFTVEGPGVLDCKLFEKGNSLILHIVNHSGAECDVGHLREIYPVGAQQVFVRTNRKVESVRLVNAKKSLEWKNADGGIAFVIDRITDQELVIIQ